MTKANGRFILFITLTLAALFSIAPLPPGIDSFRPDWMLLVLLYWTLALPHRISVVSAFVAGLVLDLLLGSTLGVRSLAFSICIYVVAYNHQLIRNLSVWQQALLIGGVVLLSKVIIFWTEQALGHSELGLSFLGPVLSAMLLWPWLFLLLRKIRRHYRVM